MNLDRWVFEFWKARFDQEKNWLPLDKAAVSISIEQEISPVGCVPSTAVTVGGCASRGDVHASGCTCQGAYLPRGYLPMGVPASWCTCEGCTCKGVCIPACTEADTRHLWTEWLTDTCENITLQPLGMIINRRHRLSQFCCFVMIES